MKTSSCLLVACLVATLVAGSPEPAAAQDHTRVKTPAVAANRLRPPTRDRTTSAGPSGARRRAGRGRRSPRRVRNRSRDRLARRDLDERPVHLSRREDAHLLPDRHGGRRYKSQDLKTWTGPYSIIDLKGTWMDGRFVAAAEIHHIGDKYYLAGTWNDHNHLIENIPRRYNVPTNQTQLLVADTPEGPYKPLVPEFEFCLGPGTGTSSTAPSTRRTARRTWSSSTSGPRSSTAPWTTCRSRRTSRAGPPSPPPSSAPAKHSGRRR